MNLIVKNFEKIILGIALIVLIATQIVSIGEKSSLEQFDLSGIKLDEKMPSKEVLVSSDRLLSKLKTPETYESYSGIRKRNVFTFYKKTATLPKSPVRASNFIVLSIERKAFPLEYKGRIKPKTGASVAQINYHKRTYFVETYDKVLNYIVTRITDKQVALEDQGTKETINLVYLKPQQTKELVANIMDTNENKIYEIEAGSRFGDYNVLDITSDTVILSNGKKQIVIPRE